MEFEFNNPLVSGKVKEICPKIYCVIIDDDYDRAMLFCRYQEFYESPLKQIKGKHFSWIEYMRLYKNFWKKRTFTYPDDWAGYNIPSNILKEAVEIFNRETIYDDVMGDIYSFCSTDSARKNDYIFTDWYLIGVNSKDTRTINHEIAHGLYYTNKEYKKRINDLLKKIPKKVMDNINKKLIKLGYVNKKKILDDEAHAFLCTGLYGGLETKDIKKYQPEFQKTFNEFMKKTKL
jgi:hypothetical protein